ncbi:type II secretion system F family protein [Desulfocurvus sp. DL9XJH121]
MNFKYKALTDSGSTVSGSIAAENPEHARQLIAAKGFIPQSVKEGGGGDGDSASPAWMEAVNRWLAKVKADDLMLFTKQFRTMLDAGLPVSRLLQVLEQQTENRKLKFAIVAMQQDINQGASMYKAFSAHPACFNELYCSMLRAGEISGNVTSVMERLIYLIDHESKVRGKIKSALTYPAIVLVTLIGAFFFLLNFVIPKFIPIFRKAKLDLPWPTELCIAMNQGLQHYWHVGLIALAVLVAAVILYCKTPQGRHNRDKLYLKVPLIGPVLKKAAMSRFSSIFAILQSSGVSVLESVSIISRTIGNAAIAREFDSLEDKLKEGRGISAPLKTSKYFTPMVINMIAIGEETGNLDEMLQEVAKHYDYEVEYSVNKMSDMIGPLLVLGLSFVVGFFAMAVMLPIFDLVKMAQ